MNDETENQEGQDNEQLNEQSEQHDAAATASGDASTDEGAGGGDSGSGGDGSDDTSPEPESESNANEGDSENVGNESDSEGDQGADEAVAGDSHPRSGAEAADQLIARINDAVPRGIGKTQRECINRCIREYFDFLDDSPGGSEGT